MLLNVISLAVFSTLVGVVFVAARAQMKTTIYSMRQAEAQAIAEAGMEDAMHELYTDSNWRAGFTMKPFAGGFYTVTLTTTAMSPDPVVTSTGYSKDIFMFGPGVKTVTGITSLTPNLCPYALAGSGALNIDGTVDRYSPLTTLTPSATEFIATADIRSNSTVATSQTCPPVLVRGKVTQMAGAFPSNCAEDTVTVTTEPLTIPSVSCPTCDTVNANNTGITPAGMPIYNDGSKRLNITASNTATLAPGNYYFRIVNLAGTLNVDTTSGTVNIFLDPGTFSTTAGCQINNLSKLPWRLNFASLTTTGHTLEFRCSTPLHAHFSGSFAKTDLYQEVYGHLCSDRVDIKTTGKLHYDGTSRAHVSWTSGVGGSWQENYTRP